MSALNGIREPCSSFSHISLLTLRLLHAVFMQCVLFVANLRVIGTLDRGNEVPRFE
jgi:hypothetical protein